MVGGSSSDTGPVAKPTKLLVAVALLVSCCSFEDRRWIETRKTRGFLGYCTGLGGGGAELGG